MGWIWKAVRKEICGRGPLPWDHFDTGVSKGYLLREYQRALAGQVTKDCREGCLGCGMAVLLDEEDKGVCASADMD